MNRNSLIWIAAFGLFLLPASAISLGGCAPQPATLEQVAAPLSEEELRKLAESITVKVLAKNGAGSGTLIGKQKGVYTVLTNQHVLTPGQPYSIQTPDGKTHTASVVKKADFQGKDLVLLEFPAAEEYAVAALGHRRSFAVGDKVLAAGFPFDSDRPIVSAGKIELLPDKALQGGYRIGYTNDIQQGMSGGPVLNYFGEVTGINGVSAFPILADAYRFEDGSRPSEAQLQQMKRLSWGVPVQILAEVAPERVALIPPNPPLKRGGKENSPPFLRGAGGDRPLTGIAGEVDKKAAEITVRIDGQNGNGSGVIVAKRGNTYYVLTADHVVENKGEYQVVTPDGARVPVNYGTVTRFEGVDLAVLQFQSNETYSVATLEKYEIKGPAIVFVSGWPGLKGASNSSRLFTGGLMFSQEAGAILAKDSFSLTNGYELVYTNITQGGMSGGPVLDTRGRVIGIHAAAEGDGLYDVQLGLSLGVPVRTFISLAEKAGIKPEWLSVETSAPPPINELKLLSLLTALFTLEKPARGARETDWVNYGNQLWRLFRFDEAVKAFDEAVKLKPEFYQAWYARGLALREQDKYQEALASFDRATQIKPNLYEAWRERGNVLYFLNRYPEALASYDKAIAFNDKDSVLYMWRGDLLYKLKRYPEARDAYSRAITLKPHPFAYNSRGFARSDLGDKQGAIADYNKAIELKPDDAEAYNNRGNARYHLGDKKGAIADYTKAIELKPDLAYAYSNRGNARYQLGDKQGAIADYNKAIELKLDDAKAYYNRGVARSALGDKQGAIADYNKAIELKPDYAEAYNNRGNARDDLGDKQGEIADYSKAIELKPDLAEAHYNRGVARSDLGDKQGAIADFSKAIELKPDYAEAYGNRGNARSDLGDKQGAIADYSKAIELKPDDAGAYGNRGVDRYALGDKQGAIEDIQKAAQLYCAQGHPKCQTVQDLLKKLQK
jgi:tetratricopeptide (TPR) repeat protein/S1-C subfamily serine protease